MWTATTQAQHRRNGLLFASNLSDAWPVIEPPLPPPAPVGRPLEWPMRRIVNAFFYVVRGGILWRVLPLSFRPRQTVNGWFAAWRAAGVWQLITHHLMMQDRKSVGREVGPSAAVIDAQSIKTSDAAGPRGYDASKKVVGRKRHTIVDTDGRALVPQVHPACVQDHDRVAPLLIASRRSSPFVELSFADRAYAGEHVAGATRIAIEIVRKRANQVGFAEHPGRWVVERCFAWLGRDRRFAKDFKVATASVPAFLYAASAMLLTRRIARRT